MPDRVECRCGEQVELDPTEYRQTCPECGGLWVRKWRYVSE